MREGGEKKVFGNQFGFLLGWSTMEAIYLLKCLMYRSIDKYINLHITFIDLERAYDRVIGEVLWKVLEKK